MKGKEKCKILKEIRQKIATENDIPFVTSECKHQGDCRGTCPKCEAELVYLENELAKRRMLGKRIAVAGLVASFTLAGTACGFGQTIESGPENAGAPPIKDELDGDVEVTAGESPVVEEYVLPSVVLYNDTVMLQEDAEPYVSDQYVFVSGHTSVTYASDNEAVFKVDEKGTITPVAPGEATLKVAAFGEGGGETVKEMKVVIREIWRPTDPDSKEVVEIMQNENLVQAPLSFWKCNFSSSEWDKRENPTKTDAGPVEIWANHLQMLLNIPKEGDDAFDATIGFDFTGKDMSNYKFSFKMFLREQNLEDDRTQYKAVPNHLVPWSIYDAKTLVIYRCTFYDSGLLDIVEKGKTYDVVVVIYEGDEARAWGSTTMEWTDSCELFIEAAENNQDVIK